MSKQTSTLLKGTWFNRKAILLIDSPVFLLSTYYVLSTVLMLGKSERIGHTLAFFPMFSFLLPLMLLPQESTPPSLLIFLATIISLNIQTDRQTDRQTHTHTHTHTPTHTRLDKGSWLDKGSKVTVEAAWIWDSQWDLLSLRNWRRGFRWVVAGLHCSGFLCPVDLSCLRFP